MSNVVSLDEWEKLIPVVLRTWTVNTQQTLLEIVTPQVTNSYLMPSYDAAVLVQQFEQSDDPTGVLIDFVVAHRGPADAP